MALIFGFQLKRNVEKNIICLVLISFTHTLEHFSSLLLLEIGEHITLVRIYFYDSA